MSVNRSETETSRVQTQAGLRSWLMRSACRYRKEDDGVMVIFSMFFLIMILMVGGIGVDMMRFEMDRTRLQYTLDRAVLAAADLDQTLDPQAVVTDYFKKSGMDHFLADVDVDQGLNFRTVSATATAEMDTQFMRMMGVDTMYVPAAGAAEERIAKVEISMVLDISGSMESNSRISNLRQAGKAFVDTVVRPETMGQISVSLVPYSEQVNAGPDIINEMNYGYKHSYSHCLEIPDSQYSSTTLSTTYQYEQMQHYQWNYDGYNNDRSNTVCPRWDYERIKPLSQNATSLKNQINSLQPRAGTAIYLGMKWGVALLDPSMRPVVSDLVNTGKVDNAFSGRPADYTDPETLKTVILMTDGENSSTQRISSYYYANSSHYAHWDRYNFNWYLSRYVNSWQRSSWYYEKYNKASGDYLLDKVCDAAKDKGIVIWAIGFEVTSQGADVMRNCASSPSHFFRVEGIEINDAFQAIARQINQLRLTQ